MSIQKNSKYIGVSKMDMDTDVGFMDPNDVRLLLNARSVDREGKNNVIRNIKSTVKITGVDYERDTQKVIGTVENEASQSIIYFLFGVDVENPTPAFYHRIMEYFPEDNHLEIILEHAVLKFNWQHRIKGAKVIDGLLYWNDAYNRPRKINIAKAKAYMDDPARDDAYPFIDEQTISLIKYPPLNQITPWYDTDENRETNSLRGLLFQFRYQYIYDDNEYSTASFISKVAIPSGETDYSGELVGYLNVNNKIIVRIYTGHHTVEKIIIFVRHGNIGHWGEVEILDKKALGLDDEVYYDYSFYNDRVIDIADQLKLNQLFHNVPLITDMLSYLHTNQLVLAGNLVGYDNLKSEKEGVDAIDVELYPIISLVQTVKAITFIQDWPNEYVEYLVNWTDLQDGNYQLTFVTGMLITDFVGNLPTLFSMIKFDIEGQLEEFVVLDDDWTVSAGDFAIGLGEIVTQHFDGYEGFTEIYAIDDPLHTNNLVPDNCLFIKNRVIYIVGPIETETPDDAPFTVTLKEFTTNADAFKAWSAWKSGARHYLGLIYYDEANRSGTVQKAGSLYLPALTEPAGQALMLPENTTKYNHRYSIKTIIKHYPPVWATHYQWCYAKNDVIVFRQYVINGVEQGTNADDTIDIDRMAVDISPLNKHKVQYNKLDLSFQSSSIEPWQFQIGDRIRFLTKEKTDFSGGAGLGDLLPFYLDVEILDYKILPPTDADDPGGATNELIIQDFDIVVYPDIGENSLIEIYRPKKKQEDLIYYELGNVFPVFNPGTDNRVHSGSRYNQELPFYPEPIAGAMGFLREGDVYHVPTVFSKNLATTLATKHLSIIEGHSASNFYDLDVHNYGRPNIHSANSKQEKILSIRPSGTYFENTNVNRLSEFTSDRDSFVSSEFGNINGLNEIGFTLKVLQEYKVTSFYIDRAGLQLADDSGGNVLAGSGEVLGTKNPSLNRYGTTNPESVFAINRFMYFVDVLNGKILRDGNNGMEIISDQDISSEIKNICDDLIKDYTSSFILTGYNPNTEEVMFAFNGFDGEFYTHLGTYIWDQKKLAWRYVLDLSDSTGDVPIAFGHVGQTFVSFLKAHLWKHEAGTDYNYFYGDKKNVEIDMYFGTVDKTKAFKSLEVIGKGNWSAPGDGDVLIPARYSIDQKEMQSRLKSGRFRVVTGKIFADFMKDISTNTFSNTDNLMNGKDLKGMVIRVKLSNNDDQEAYISVVSVLYQPIELS